MIDITRQAGQRNRGALHYHFGSRVGVLCAVLERHVDFLARREGELLELALKRPDDDVESVVEAIVRPASELAESGWRGRCFLMILAELIDEDPASLDPQVSDALARTGGYEVYVLLARRMAAVSDEVRADDSRLSCSSACGRRSGPGAQPAGPARASATRIRSVRAQPGRDGRGGHVGSNVASLT